VKENFVPSLALVLISEGGFVNDPKDPGGATNQGVTQEVYDHYRAEEHLVLRSVKFINTFEIGQIYNRDYWHPCHCDELPSGVDYCTFDFGVNSGPGRAIRALQRAIGSKPDGWIGPATLAALMTSNPDDIIEKICADRMAFLQRLPTWEHFGLGWKHRVDLVELKALGMTK
jgi:lysozyme family protein